MTTALTRLENIVRNTEESIKRRINPLPANAPPLLNLPSETVVDYRADNEIVNYNIYYDYINYLNNLFFQIYKNNKWARLSIDVTATVATNCEPFFVLNSVKSKRDKFYIDRLSKRLAKPNYNDTWYTLFEKIYKSLPNFGNSYLQVIKDFNGELHSLYHIPALTIKPFPYVDKITGLLRFLFIQVQYIDQFTYKVQRVFRDDEIIHFKLPNHLSELMGMGYFYTLLASLDIDEEMNKWLDGYFKNNFNAGLIIQQSNTNSDAVERNRQIIKENFQGGQNSFNVMLLEGELEIKNDGNKTKDFPMVEVARLNRDNILVCAKTPLSVLGMRSGAYPPNQQEIEAEEQSFLRNNILDLQNIVFSTLNHKLIDQILDSEDISIDKGVNNQFSRHNVVELAGALAKTGARVNEIRHILGVADLIDNDFGETVVIMTNNGLIPVDSYSEGLQLDVQIKQKQLDNMSLPQNNTTPAVKPEPTKQQSLKVSADGVIVE